MFRVQWFAGDRLVMTPAGEFRSMVRAAQRASARLPTIAAAFGITEARIVDAKGRCRRIVRPAPAVMLAAIGPACANGRPTASGIIDREAA